MTRFAIVLAASLAACGDGEDLNAPTPPAQVPGLVSPSVAPDPAPLCDRVCEARATLACPRATGDCQATCSEAVRGACGSQWATYFRCFADSAPGERVCSARGQPDLAPGVCAQAHGELQRCLTAALSAP